MLVASEPALYVERGGRGLITFAGAGDRLATAIGALGEAVRAGRVPKLALERLDGEPVVGSAVEPLLVEHGFRSGPRKLTLSA